MLVLLGILTSIKIQRQTVSYPEQMYSFLLKTSLEGATMEKKSHSNYTRLFCAIPVIPLFKIHFRFFILNLNFKIEIFFI